MGSAGALPIWNCPRVIFLMTLSDTLLISAHKAVVSERKKILYNFLIWSADSGSSLSISCALQLDFICCLPAHKWESCIILHLDHRYSSEMCLVPFLNDQWNRDCATETNHSEKQFSSLHFFNFPATPLHSSTISSCPQRRLQDKNTSLRYAWLWEVENLSQTQTFYAVRNYPLPAPHLFNIKKEKQILSWQKANKCSS